MRSAWSRYGILTAIIIGVLLSSAFASDLKSTIDITKVGKGARPIALGGAYTALAGDTSAIFTNPAGLGIQDKLSITSMNTQLMGCVDYKLIGGSYPTPYGTVAIGYVDASTPAGNHTYISGGVTVEAGAMYYSNRMIIVSYGGKMSNLIPLDIPVLKNIAIGANVKLFSQGFSGDLSGAPSASGSDIDFGLIYKVSDCLSIGGVLQNLSKSSDGEMSWSTGEKEEIAGINKIGAVCNLNKNLRTTVDIDFMQGNTPMIFHGGIEWDVMDYLALRGGIDQNYESVSEGNAGITTDLSGGVGINLGEFRFDYAYHNNQAMPENSTHYFSISYFLDPKVLSAKRDINKEQEPDDPYSKLIKEENKKTVKEEKIESPFAAQINKANKQTPKEEKVNDPYGQQMAQIEKLSAGDVKADNPYSKQINEAEKQKVESQDESADDYYSNLDEEQKDAEDYYTKLLNGELE